MDKKTKGNVAELAVATRLMNEGWNILFPYGEKHRYDLVVEKNARFVRVQVKYATPKNGALQVRCRSSNNWSVLAYDRSQIDVIAAYNPEDGCCYFIPASELCDTMVSLRVSGTRNKQRKNVRFAEDYGTFVYTRPLVTLGLDKFRQIL